MHRLALTAALLTPTPLFAQNTSPFQGPMPNTVVLASGWQMTPGLELCTLTHRAAGRGQDLVVIAPRGKDEVVLGTIVAARGAYTTPVQLTVVALAGQPQQIGRVTFKPKTGVLGTLLSAIWSSDRLLPWLTSATRLRFISPVTSGSSAQSIASSPAFRWRVQARR